MRAFFFTLTLFTSLYSFENSIFFQKLSEPTPQWMFDQIEEDLAPHGIDLSQYYIEEIFSKNHDLLKLVRVRVINGEVNVFKSTSTTNHPTPDLIIPHLYALSKLIRLPDIDFLFTAHDGMFSPLPIFCVTKGCVTGLSEEEMRKGNGIIVIPDMFAFGGYEPNKTQVLEGNLLYPWDDKINLAFYRGSDIGVDDLSTWMNYPRPRLVLLSNQHPHLIDAKFTGLYSACHTKFAQDNGLMGQYLSMKDHPRYKYLMNVEAGCANTPRFSLLLHTNSVVLKNETNSILWFYKALSPFEHFIPVAGDLSDLLSKIEWAKDHDSECKKISENARKLAAEVLTSEAVYLYLYRLLEAYSLKQKSYYNCLN